jgi:hypothetical protein
MPVMDATDAKRRATAGIQIGVLARHVVRWRITESDNLGWLPTCVEDTCRIGARANAGAALRDRGQIIHSGRRDVLAGLAPLLTAGVRLGKSARRRHAKRDHDGETRQRRRFRGARGARASGPCRLCVRRSGRRG